MSKKIILIVDDEIDFAEMVKLNLEATGDYEVQTENKADNAVNTVLQCRPNLILMDIVMPDRDGPDIVREIRKNKAIAGIPVVFLTATVTREEIEEAKGKAPENTFLAKPSTIKELVDCIERHTLPSSG